MFYTMHFLPPEKRKTIFSKDNIEATLHLISDDLQNGRAFGRSFRKAILRRRSSNWLCSVEKCGYVENTMKKYLL